MTGSTSTAIGRAGRRISDRRLPSSWSFGFNPEGPHFRYALISLLIVWLIALTAANYLPQDYVSRATLIVPGTSPSVSVSLDSIGQSSTTPTSTYNTGSLSPKVIYREMAQSEGVRSAAAQSVGLTLAQFGSPRIRLVDETALILIEFRAATPEAAELRVNALIGALQKQLDSLRRDELERRSSAVQDNLKTYQTTLSAARDRISALQAETGLVSSNQFHETSTSLVMRHRRLAELKADLDRLTAEQATLTDQLAITAKEAAIALRLVGDPAFSKLILDYSDASVLLKNEKRRLGPESPTLIQLQQKWDSITTQIESQVRRSGLSLAGHVDTLVLLTNNSHQADLFKRLVSTDQALSGKRSELATTLRDVETLEKDLRRLSAAAAQLEDLKKEHLVAEAVFTTAMARLNTSKSDIYGSYPLVQTLAPASRPSQIASNGPKLAFAGGVGGTILISLAWFFAWLRADFVRKRLKSI